MAFREYKIGARMFGIALGSSMFITLVLPTIDIAGGFGDRDLAGQAARRRPGDGVQRRRSVHAGLEQAAQGDAAHRSEDRARPIDKPAYVYVFKAGAPFPSGILHPITLGSAGQDLAIQQGKILEAKKSEGAVFGIAKVMKGDQEVPYIENLTATRGWTPAEVLKVATDADIAQVGKGKTMFVREGCWWCHTLLPEETQDWQVFGAPPMLGDFNGESPTAFGSDRKAPDLLHVGSRNSSREWLMMHFFNPRLVQPHSIMPRFDYLWGDKDASGKPIDFDKWRAEYIDYREGRRVTPPDVPQYAPDSEIRSLIDFIISLK